MVRLKEILLVILSVISIHAEARVVRDVEIKKTGITYEKKHTEECEAFRPIKEQVIHFFNSAKELKEAGSLLHEYYSPCIATGSVTFKNGLSGTWVLQSSGFASFFVGGKEKAIFFYRGNKWEDPFGCVYGSDDDLSC
ncbi:hypothetical protein [Rouxiella sp. Mn2063]|uniref:hypothetical protein n=1 Tax=Rouxiella sp. Mn2063 TaxID=3395262 RepID=UPI003BE8722B